MTPAKRWIILAATLLTPGLAAQHEEHPDHVPLERVENLDVAEVLEIVVQHAPSAIEAPVREQQAADFQAQGRSWIAGRPSLYFTLYNDGLLDDQGQVEQEAGLQLPLRRPGEMRAAQEQGERYERELDAWQDNRAWQLAGLLRVALADLEVAETLLQTQKRAVASAEDVFNATQGLFDAGEVARLDLLQAQNLLLTERQSLLEAEAVLVDAERKYTVLTGIQQRPANPHREVLNPREEIDAQHPLLRYLQAQAALAAGTVRQNEIANKGSPQLSIGTRRERSDRFTPYTDALAVSLNIPIGGGSYVSSRTSEARLAQADAEVQLLATRRDLQRMLHEAEHELFVTRQALPLAEQQAGLGEQRSTMARSAFEAGETDLVRVLQAVQEAARSSREYALLQLREQHLIIQYNHFLGVTP